MAHHAPSTTSCTGNYNLPGFGHKVYKEGDPRFVALWDLASPLLSEERRRLFLEILERAAAHGVPQPNCDLALAALSWGTGMPPDAGRTIFTVARIAGWTAHYQEELMQRPLRFRDTGGLQRVGGRGPAGMGRNGRTLPPWKSGTSPNWHSRPRCSMTSTGPRAPQRRNLCHLRGLRGGNRRRRTGRRPHPAHVPGLLLNTELLGRRQPGRHVGPVDDVPQGGEEVGLDVLVLEIEGVLPASKTRSGTEPAPRCPGGRRPAR